MGLLVAKCIQCKQGFMMHTSFMTYICSDECNRILKDIKNGNRKIVIVEKVNKN